MKIGAIIDYMSHSHSHPSSSRTRTCACEKRLYVANSNVQFRVLYVLARDVRARVWENDEEVGTWTIRARREPLFVCERDGKVYILTRDGHPYAHPHVFSDGRLCFGDNAPNAARTNIFSALFNINLNSAVWRPRGVRRARS